MHPNPSDHDSAVLAVDYPLPRDPHADSGIDKFSTEPTLQFTLVGDVLGCACPDCNSPMSVRVWLMVADCWACGCSIELSEEQEQQALRLLEQEHAPPAELPRFVPPPVEVPKPAQPAFEPPPAVPTFLAPAFQPPPEIPEDAPTPGEPLPSISPNPPKKKRRRGKKAAAVKSIGVRKHLEEIREQGWANLWVRDRFSEMPAWLTSLVFHLVALILLGMMVQSLEEEDDQLVLSVRISDVEPEGDPDQLQEQPAPTPFDISSEIDVKELAPQPLETPDVNPFDQQAATALMEIQSEPLDVLAAAEVLVGAEGMFNGRGETSRGKLVQAYGGTSASEAAVARGLKWLADHQNKDGSWRLNEHGGNVGSDTAATAMGLLPFLGAGQTHREGRYKTHIQKGLDWLVKQQKPDGDLRSGAHHAQMYAHAQCAITLCEAYALSKDEKLRDPAQKAIDFVVKAQSPDGGWRYQPGRDSDTSVVGWQLMALRSAQMAYLKVPRESFTKTVNYLNKAQTDKVGSQYAYQPGAGAKPAMSAEGLLCRQYTGWPQYHPGLIQGTVQLLRSHPPKASDSNMYYWYYATQVMHHQGGQVWTEWNDRMRELLVTTQVDKGPDAGSWTPHGSHDKSGGRVYMTSLSVLTLEVYYRHLPLYNKSAVDDLAQVGTPAVKVLPETKPAPPPPAKKTPETAKKPSQPLKKQAFDILGGNPP